MIDFFHLKRPFVFSARKEEWFPEDQANRDTFVTSILCAAIEKELKNRMAERETEALARVGHLEGQLAKAKMEELADILLGWQNLRSDLQKKHGK